MDITKKYYLCLSDGYFLEKNTLHLNKYILYYLRVTYDFYKGEEDATVTQKAALPGFYPGFYQ